MELLSKINNDPRIASAVLIIMLLITIIIKYKKLLYYNFDNPNVEKNILSRVYRLNTKRIAVDIQKINKQLFVVDIAALIASGLVMVIFNMIVGFVLYLIVSNLGIYLLSHKIGKYYSAVFEEKYGTSKKHKKNK